MEETFTQRKNPRLQEYDYSLAGGYFVTVCASQRGSLFGVVEEGEVVLNQIGMMVEQCWVSMTDRFQTVELDEFILMPDHFHAVLFLLDTTVGAGLHPAHKSQTHPISIDRATTRVAPTLGRIIGAFKSISTNQYFSGVRNQGWPALENKLWQRGYFDRIIRDDEELDNIRNYIIHNAIKQAPPEFFSEAKYETRT